MTTIQNHLDIATNNLATLSDSPRLDAEVLLAFVLEKNRSYLRAWNDKKIDDSEVQRFDALISQRLKGVPIAYLTGTREFWSRDFIVSPDVLIPRPDTELLIELCLAQIPMNSTLKILDLGTGSGAIAITLAAERPNTQIFAVDASSSALVVAQKNAHQHDCQNIKFILSDWFSAVPKIEFDLIISNPPYISANDEHLSQGDVRFEPKSALIAADNGLSDIKKIAVEAINYLKPYGQLWFEHGYNQAQAVQHILKGLNYFEIQTHQDLAGQPRVTKGNLGGQ
ncbi:MAG: peptide chain release factor N(5)-glutamine methyltransferase [Methylococcaceae bacterium]|jgi:release factor glutamine methyltransferase